MQSDRLDWRGFVLPLRDEVFHESLARLFARWCWDRVPCRLCGRTNCVGRRIGERHRRCHLVLGSFLAGAGAIAGAVIGGVADLREFFKRKDQASDRKALK